MLDTFRINAKFNALKWENSRRNGMEAKLEITSVLKGEIDDIEKVVRSLLAIIFRLRNNFFHGKKWVYQLQDQVDNFRMANGLIAAILTLVKQAGLIKDERYVGI